MKKSNLQMKSVRISYSEDFDEALIDFLKNKRFIHDNNEKLHWDYEATNEAYQEISSQLGLTCEYKIVNFNFLFKI